MNEIIYTLYINKKEKKNCYREIYICSFSNYPSQRVKQDENKEEVGVAGTLSLLQNVTLSTQPINALDWSPDKEGLCVCTAFDQAVRVLIVTKLNRIWLMIFKKEESFVIGPDVFSWLLYQ